VILFNLSGHGMLDLEPMTPTLRVTHQHIDPQIGVASPNTQMYWPS